MNHIFLVHENFHSSSGNKNNTVDVHHLNKQILQPQEHYSFVIVNEKIYIYNDLKQKKSTGHINPAKCEYTPMKLYLQAYWSMKCAVSQLI